MLEIKSLGEYVEIIDNLFNTVSNRGLWFRGHANKNYKLLPSVYRTSNPDKKSLSQKVYDGFYKRAGLLMTGTIPPHEDKAFWLTTGQHYGLPTKLLDWTNSPLIALYFAVEALEDNDGCVWVLNSNALNQNQIHSDYIEAVALEIAVAESAAQRLGCNDLSNAIVACWPTNNDARVIFQQSRFTYHNFEAPMEDDEIFQSFLTKINIPSAFKRKLDKQLEHCGIRRHTIFPDFEHVAKYLKKLYGL